MRQTAWVDEQVIARPGVWWWRPVFVHRAALHNWLALMVFSKARSWEDAGLEKQSCVKSWQTPPTPPEDPSVFPSAVTEKTPALCGSVLIYNVMTEPVSVKPGQWEMAGRKNIVKVVSVCCHLPFAKYYLGRSHHLYLLCFVLYLP